MYELICTALRENGYHQYELSNFSLKGRESKHNLKYWLGDEYIGLGASASSLYKNTRYTNLYDFNTYIETFEKTDVQHLTARDQMSEFMFLSLRLTAIGAVKKDFQSRFGISIEDAFGDAIQKHLANGMLKECGNRYILAEKAYYVSNTILCDFV